MSAFQVLVSLADELERMLSSFEWGSKNIDGRSLNWFVGDISCHNLRQK